MISIEKISIVIPVLNEEESIEKLYFEIVEALQEFNNKEIIFIDDGSEDESNKIIKEIINKDNSVVLIQLYKNYGKADALSRGFKYASGDIVVTIDSDLQDDPAEIPNLINKITEGWDVVSGWKKNRKDPASKRIPSKFFNFVTRKLTGINIHDFNCGIKAYRKKVIKSIDVYGGMHRYIPALAYKKGFSVTELIVNHRSRKYGISKYTSNRLFHGFFDLFTMLFITKYLDRPLHFFGFAGLFIIFFSLSCEMFALYDKIFNGIPFQKHFALIVFGAIVFILGLWLFSVGLLGELIIKTLGTSEEKVHSIYSKEIV